MLHKKFIVEGVKLVRELLQSDFKIEELYCISEWEAENNKMLLKSEINTTNISEKELKQISELKTPNKVLAVVKQKEISGEIVDSNILFVLDNVQDPGNLGTIIRTADWFGITQIFCSENSVECYNSKVVQASMGSVFRVGVKYGNILNMLKEFESNGYRITVASLEGKSLIKVKNNNKMVVVFGNESQGVSPEVMAIAHEKISISGRGKAESLNVASAFAVFCYELVGKS